MVQWCGSVQISIVKARGVFRKAMGTNFYNVESTLQGLPSKWLPWRLQVTIHNFLKRVLYTATAIGNGLNMTEVVGGVEGNCF